MCDIIQRLCAALTLSQQHSSPPSRCQTCALDLISGSERLRKYPSWRTAWAAAVNMRRPRVHTQTLINQYLLRNLSPLSQRKQMCILLSPLSNPPSRGCVFRACVSVCALWCFGNGCFLVLFSAQFRHSCKKTFASGTDLSWRRRVSMEFETLFNGVNTCANGSDRWRKVPGSLFVFRVWLDSTGGQRSGRGGLAGKARGSSMCIRVALHHSDTYKHC